MAKQGKLLATQDVLRVTNFARSTLDRLIRKQAFPAPLDLGVRRNLWRESDVAEWIEARCAPRRTEERP